MIIVFSLRQHYQTLYMGEPLYYKYETNHCDAFITDVYLEKSIFSMKNFMHLVTYHFA